MTDKEIIQIFSDKRGKINPNRTRSTWLDKNPQIKEYLENRYSIFFDYVTTLQFIFHGLDEPPKCEKCGKYLDSIRRWCDQKCQLTDPNFIEQREQVIDYNAKVEKTKNTMLERYVVSNGFKTDLCKRNSHTKEARQKAVETSKQTCLAKYGVENSSQVKEVQEKV